MSEPHIVVIGSSNTDLVIRSARLPRPGQTVLGGDFGILAGGKGANQAVAAARAGARVTFVANMGRDRFGDEALGRLQGEGIDTRYVVRIDSVGAGDCFTGALAAALALGESMDAAVNFAIAAAMVSVTRRGAQPSMPTRREILRALRIRL